jgi:hypothetical protein
MASPAQRAVSEALGTAFLLATVIGSGIMAQRLAGGNGALALLCNTLPTGAILTVLILIFGPVSGAHFNPAVSVAFALRGDLPWPMAFVFVAVQLCGAVIGVWAAHLMFELPVWQLSTRRYVWSFANDLRLRCASAGCCRIRRGPLHYGRLLVHCINLICESCGDISARFFEYLRGHRAGWSHCFHRRAIGRRSTCNSLSAMALGGQ